jgi:hypothetical protein
MGAAALALASMPAIRLHVKASFMTSFSFSFSQLGMQLFVALALIASLVYVQPCRGFIPDFMQVLRVFCFASKYNLELTLYADLSAYSRSRAVSQLDRAPSCACSKHDCAEHVSTGHPVCK